MRRIGFLLFIAFITFYFISCETTNPEPPELVPVPGYQHDIPWPSLADSPWPMNHHDPQSTGRSKYPGPILGEIEWSFPAPELNAGLSIDNNSNVYLSLLSGLFALESSGSLLWSFSQQGGYSFMTPIISADEIIYAGVGKILYAVNLSGDLLWEFETKQVFESMVNIGLEGTLYVIDRDKNLYAVSGNGELLWEFNEPRFNYYATGVSFSPDGQTLYVPGSEESLIAFDINTKSIKWTYGNVKMFLCPIVDSQGNIYILPEEIDQGSGFRGLYCIDSFGNEVWNFRYYSRSNSFTIPTIDRLGNIYYATTDTLFSLDYYGNINWKTELTGSSSCPLVCDFEDNIYVGMDDFPDILMVKYNQEGNKIWEIRVNWETGGLGPSPALNNSCIYLPTWESGNIYKIK